MRLRCDCAHRAHERVRPCGFSLWPRRCPRRARFPYWICHASKERLRRPRRKLQGDQRCHAISPVPASALSLHRRRELYHKRTMATDRFAACLEQQGTAAISGRSGAGTAEVFAMCVIKLILSAAVALMVASIAHAAACKRGEPRCGMPLQKACTDPESGVDFPKGYMCINDPNKWGWQCEIHDGEFRFYKTKGSGGKRKRDAVCE